VIRELIMRCSESNATAFLLLGDEDPLLIKPGLTGLRRISQIVRPIQHQTSQGFA